MSMQDPLSDMLTRIRNAQMAGKKSVEMPGSKLKAAVAKVLKEEGYIRNYKFIKDNKQGILRVYLRYDDNNAHAIYNLNRISKPSRRVYLQAREIKPVYNGLGVAVFSTSKGLMTDRRARKENIGGELLCTVW